MILGIISEPKSYTRKYYFKRIFNIRCFEEISNTSNPFDAVADILPFSREQLKKISAVRLERLITKKILLFQKNNITALILSDFLYSLCKLKNIDTLRFINGRGNRLFLGLMPLCLRETAKKAGLELFSSNVCIRDSKMDRISEYIMRELCFDTKKLCLATKNLSHARIFCKSFYDETGLWVDITDNLHSRFDACLDVDNCRLEIGHDLFVRDARFGFDFCGYAVSHTDTLSALPGLQPINPEWIYDYSKKQ